MLRDKHYKAAIAATRGHSNSSVTQPGQPAAPQFSLATARELGVRYAGPKRNTNANRRNGGSSCFPMATIEELAGRLSVTGNGR